MTEPLISVITAVYNGADYLPALIESVQAQDYPHVEHIIIDDGSTDNTAAVLAGYPQVRWWSRENKGQYATQNEGIAAAQGEIIVIISADDVFITPHTFSQVVAHWQPETDLIYGKTRRMDEQGGLLPDIEITSRPSRWLLRQIVYVQHCSVFVSGRLLRESDLYFDDTFRYAGDWDWLIRLFDAAQHITYLKQPLAIIRMHHQQTSRTTNAAAVQAEHRRVSMTYGGSYRLHMLIGQLINYRAMALLALDILRKRGPKALFKQGQAWLKRKVAS